MEKNTDDCYIVNWQEGARGSFICDLLCLLLMDDKNTIIPIKREKGDAGMIARPLVGRAVHHDYSIKFPESTYQSYLKNNAECDFMLYHGFPTKKELLIDYDFLTKKYKNWKCIWIVQEPDERLLVETINFFKKDCFNADGTVSNVQNLYHSFYRECPELQINGIDHPKDLSPTQLKRFLAKYIEVRGIANDCHVSEIFDSRYESLPTEVKSRIYKLNFMDITTNMDKVLALLSEVTGKPITDNIVKSYKKYTIHQSLPQKYLDIIYEFDWKQVSV